MVSSCLLKLGETNRIPASSSPGKPGSSTCSSDVRLEGFTTTIFKEGLMAREGAADALIEGELGLTEGSETLAKAPLGRRDWLLRTDRESDLFAPLIVLRGEVTTALRLIEEGLTVAIEPNDELVALSIGTGVWETILLSFRKRDSDLLSLVTNGASEAQ